MVDLSVIVPSFNTAEMTLRCCRAVLTSMPASTEVIVADDGSTDGTAALLARESPEVRVVRLESNRGFAPAANQGAAAARGRIVMLLNSDAIVQPGALAAIVAAFDADPRLGVAGARLLNEDGTPQWSGGRTPTLPWILAVVSGLGPLRRRFQHPGSDPSTGGGGVDWVSGAAVAFRREAWEPLSERYRFYCQDIDACLRARGAGWDVRIVGGARVVHLLGGTVSGGGALRHDPARLWPDLLTWGAAHYGRGWAVAARLLMIAAALPRIAVSPARRSLLRGLQGLIKPEQPARE